MRSQYERYLNSGRGSSRMCWHVASSSTSSRMSSAYPRSASQAPAVLRRSLLSAARRAVALALMASPLSERYFFCSLELRLPRSPTARLWHPLGVSSGLRTGRSLPRMSFSSLDICLSSRGWGRYDASEPPAPYSLTPGTPYPGSGPPRSATGLSSREDGGAYLRVPKGSPQQSAHSRIGQPYSAHDRMSTQPYGAHDRLRAQ